MIVIKAIALCLVLPIILGRITTRSSDCHDFDESIKYPAAFQNKSVIEDHFGEKV